MYNNSALNNVMGSIITNFFQWNDYLTRIYQLIVINKNKKVKLYIMNKHNKYVIVIINNNKLKVIECSHPSRKKYYKAL